MSEEKELLGLIAALIVEIAFKESLHETKMLTCYHTTLKLFDEMTRVPYGYRLRKINGETHIVIHEKEAAIVEKIFKDFLKGMPISIIHNEVKQMGFPKTGPYAVHKILDNSFYAGLIRKPVVDENSEVFITAFHIPIINETDFYSARNSLHNERISQAKHLESMPLKGALKCACGSKMTAAWHKGKNEYYLYYRCLKHMRISYSGEKLHEQFRQLLAQLVLRNTQIDYLTKKVEDILDNVLSEYKKIIGLKNFETKEVNHKLTQVNDKFRNQEVNKETYSKWRERYLVKRHIIETEINAINERRKAVYNSVHLLISYLDNMNILYDKADYRQKQLLLASIFKDGLIYSDNKFRTVNINRALRSCIKKQPVSNKISL